MSTHSLLTARSFHITVIVILTSYVISHINPPVFQCLFCCCILVYSRFDYA
jgi:hypothetical protein